MSSTKITLITFNQYMNDIGDDLFKYLRLPKGIDKDTLTGNILMRGGEFEVVYSDPEFIQKSISIWSSKWYRTFEKWINALNIDYNPLENYDRMEEWTDNRNKSDTNNIDTVNDRTGKTSYKDDVTEGVKDNTLTENKVSAFDSDSYQPHDKSETDYTSDKTSNSHGDTSEDVSISGNTKSNGTEDEVSKHVGRTHGNIGVTTSQQMLDAELQIAEWNIYEHITDIFLSEYVIPIYS